MFIVDMRQRSGVAEEDTYESLLVDHKDGRIGLKVNTFARLDSIETLDSDVTLVRETKTDNVEHG
jgi:hypothetical protein